MRCGNLPSVNRTCGLTANEIPIHPWEIFCSVLVHNPSTEWRLGVSIIHSNDRYCLCVFCWFKRTVLNAIDLNLFIVFCSINSHLNVRYLLNAIESHKDRKLTNHYTYTLKVSIVIITSLNKFVPNQLLASFRESSTGLTIKTKLPSAKLWMNANTTVTLFRTLHNLWKGEIIGCHWLPPRNSEYNRSEMCSKKYLM